MINNQVAVDQGQALFQHVPFRGMLLISSLALVMFLSSCAFTELSGTMTRKTGEAMTDFSNKNDNLFGKLVGFGGRIQTSVGTAVENVARKGKSGELGSSKGDQFVNANKEVMNAALGAVDSQPARVRNCQQALKAQGYYKGRPDGRVGQQTRAAISKYQKDQGLQVTGILDADTTRSLAKAQ